MSPKREQRSSSVSKTFSANDSNNNSNLSNDYKHNIKKRRQTFIVAEAFHENAQICELVKSVPCLYDPSHSGYGRKEVMDEAWLMIASMCQKSATFCRERWRNLRAAYGRSISAYKTETGPNRIKPYYLHKQLEFLDPYIGKDSAELLSAKTAAAKNATREAAEEAAASRETLKRAERSSIPRPSIIEISIDSNTTTTPNSTTNVSARSERRLLRDRGGATAPPPPPLNSSKANTCTRVETSVQPTTVVTTIATTAVAATAGPTATSSPCKRKRDTSDNSNANENVVTKIRLTSTPTSLTLASPTTSTPTTTKTTPTSTTSGVDVAFIAPQPNGGVNASATSPKNSNTQSSGFNFQEDAKFLDGILNVMRDMNKRQKHIFKAKIWESVHTVLDSPHDYPSRACTTTTTVSSASTASTGGSATQTVQPTVMQQMTLNVARLNELTELRQVQRLIEQRERELVQREATASDNHNERRCSVSADDVLGICNGILNLTPIMVKQEEATASDDEEFRS